MDALFRQDPDEGYSEEPLSASFITRSRSYRSVDAADIPSWLAKHARTLPLAAKIQLIMALLPGLPKSAIASIMDTLNSRLYIDFGAYLPPEICLQILSYLDPASLVRFSCACRSYHALASDSSLWRNLYHNQGWKSVQSEISYWEARVNSRHVNNGPAAHQKRAFGARSDERKRLSNANIAASADRNSTHCVHTPAAARSEIKHSIFGDKPTVSDTTVSQSAGNPDTKGKGKQIDSPEHSSSDDVFETCNIVNADSSSIEETPDASFNVSLYNWDSNRRIYSLNWKHLYAMRKRLEDNWTAGVFTNFQFPDPDYAHEGHTECIYNLQFDSNYLVSGSRDRTIRIWNMKTRRLIRSPLHGHEGSVLCLQFDSQPEEDLIVSGSSDSDVILWRFSTGEIMQRLTHAHSESVLNVKFDKRVLVTCSKDKTIKIFNRKPLRYGDLGYPQPEGSGCPPNIIELMPRTLSADGSDQMLRELMPVVPPFTMIRCLEGHGAAVNAVQVHGREIVSASGDRFIKIWDWPDGVCRRTVVGHNKGIACVQYDGRRIVSGSNDFEVKVFDAATSAEIASLRSHTSLVRTVQSGFGDLPYSVNSDSIEARAGAAESRNASGGRDNSHASTDENPPSRNPTASSAEHGPSGVPSLGGRIAPGGGGGIYGRIVSGSYDQSIIIWRRDRTGAWRPAHQLQQDEAIVAARRSGCVNQARCEDVATGVTARSTASLFGLQHQTNMEILVERVVSQGPDALQAALMRYPTILNYQEHMMACIGREPNAWTRYRLKQAVANALRSTTTSSSGNVDRNVSQSVDALHANQDILNNFNQVPANSVRPPRHQFASPQAGPRRQAGREAAATSAVSDASNSSNQAASLPGGVGRANQPRPSHGQALHSLHGMVGPAIHPVQSQIARSGLSAHTSQHPHMTEPDSNVRIFKLQFDARRIICSSQANVIVGWDFCNGDTELEAASRFFATVD